MGELFANVPMGSRYSVAHELFMGVYHSHSVQIVRLIARANSFAGVARAGRRIHLPQGAGTEALEVGKEEEGVVGPELRIEDDGCCNV